MSDSNPTPNIPIPMSAFAALGNTDAVIAAYVALFGQPPHGLSTWAEWCAVFPQALDHLRMTTMILPLAYPRHEDALFQAAVAVAYNTAVRWETSSCPHRQRTLELVKRWLDGDATVSSAALRAAAMHVTPMYASFAAGVVTEAAGHAAAAAIDATTDANGVRAIHIADWAAHAVTHARMYDANANANANAELDRLLDALAWTAHQEQS